VIIAQDCVCGASRLQVEDGARITGAYQIVAIAMRAMRIRKDSEGSFKEGEGQGEQFLRFTDMSTANRLQ
jgi:hypothetical protein